MTAGGMLGLGQDFGCHPSWYREGLAMLCAVARDFLQLPDCRLQLMRDHRIPAAEFPGETTPVQSSREEGERLRDFAAQADYTLLIGPEMNGLLLERVRACEQVGARLLSPDSAFVAIASHKTITADRLAEQGVAVPRAISWSPGEPFPSRFPYPAVLKPVDGVGSEDTYRLENANADAGRFGSRQRWRLEQFCEGMPASIAAICGATSTLYLPVCRQRISNDGRFTYQGGRVLTDVRLNQRARRLAMQTMAALPPTRGFVGIDFILGASHEGEHDVVLEVNPRLTTSYVGLRACVRNNLAQAMLQTSAGTPVELLIGSNEVEFDPDGTVAD